MRVRALATSVALVALATAMPASAGPPFQTDDPEPTAPGEWELYAPFLEVEGRGDDFGGVYGAEINYGAAPGVQLTLSLPVAFEHYGSALTNAPGDVEVAVKWQFFKDDDAEFSAALFPAVSLPTSGKGLGSDKATLLLPLWAQKEFGPWSVSAGGGYTINPGEGNRDYWSGGIALIRSFGDDFTLGLEADRSGPDTLDGQGVTSLGLGGTLGLGGPFTFDLAGGPTIADDGETGFHAYTALGIVF